MPLYPLDLPPGLYRNGSAYQAKGRWYDANLVRWRDKCLLPVGGWAPLLALVVNGVTKSPAINVVVTGVARGIIGWLRTGGKPYLAIGTQAHLYSYSEGAQKDITPVAGFTSGAVDASSTAGGTGLYGKGFYGSGPYGVAQPLLGHTVNPDVWQLDTFGDFLVAVMAPSDGNLWVWDPATGAAVIATNAPLGNAGVVVTPEGFIVVLGPTSGSGTFHGPRAVTWASQQTYTNWDPTAFGSSAGSFPLPSAGQLVAGRRGNNETLLWTDIDLYRMTYIGGTLVYAFDRAGDSCGLIAPNAVASAETMFVWMGSRSFFTYNGYVRDLPCEVLDGVFGNFNYTQRAKVACYPNVDYGEVTWYYPSASSSENDSYVTYNYRDSWWTLGKLARTCGAPKSATFKYPVLCDPSGNVWQHEVGFTRTSAPTAPYAQSGPVEVGVGEKVLYANYLYPDDKTLGDVSVTFNSRFYPDGPVTTTGPFSLANPTPIRFTGRQTQITINEVNPVDWRVGTIRLDGSLGGKR